MSANMQTVIQSFFLIAFIGVVAYFFYKDNQLNKKYADKPDKH